MIQMIKKNKLPFLVILLYAVLFVVAPEKGSQSASNSLYYLKEMIMIMPVVFLLTVVIEAWIPKEVIMKRFGDKSGFLGSIFSLILGSVSAGPIYAAFPICKMLLSKGASIKNVVIIISAWAVIKVPMLISEAKFLSPEFMVTRWVLTVIAIFIMANIMNIFVKREDVMSVDNAKEKNQLFIKEEYCIGCGICAKILPNYYEIRDKKAIIKGEMNLEESDLILKSVEDCPTKAIVYNFEVGESDVLKN
ncbi:MAG: permease [Peptostreptococcales bacterium]